MDITKVIVEIGEVFNLGDYNNTRPTITLHADVHPGDDINVVMNQLYQTCRAKVESHIDEALMLHGKPPKFYQGARFDIWLSKKLKIVAIVSTGMEENGPEPRYITTEYGHQQSLWSLVYKEWPDFAVGANVNKTFERSIGHRDSLVLDATDYPWHSIASDHPDFQTELDRRFQAYEAAIEAQKQPKPTTEANVDEQPSDSNEPSF